MADTPLVLVLKHYGAKRVPTGNGNKGMLCPFHEDGHRSASIDTEQGVFYCFTCAVGGDALAIIMWKEACDYKEAVGIAERITGEGDISIRGSSRSSTGYGLPLIKRNLRKRSKGIPSWRGDPS